MIYISLTLPSTPPYSKGIVELYYSLTCNAFKKALMSTAGKRAFFIDSTSSVCYNHFDKSAFGEHEGA